MYLPDRDWETAKFATVSNESVFSIVRRGTPSASGTISFTGTGLITDVPSGGYHGLIVKNNGTEHFRIQSTGKVGIGSSAPAKTLEISYNDNTTNIGGNLSGAPSGPGLLIRNSNTTANIYANLDFRANNADGRIAYKYNSINDGDFHFITDNNDSIDTKMIIKNAGNVGIGLTNPSRKLTVYDASAPYLALQNSDTGTANSDGFQILHS